MTVEKFVKALINNKLISIREMPSITDFDPYEDSDSSTYLAVVPREKQPPDKK